MEQGVRPGILGVLGEVDGGRGVVGPGPGDYLNPVVNPLHTEFHCGDVFPDGHGGGLAGGAAHAYRVHPGLNLGVDELAKGVIVDDVILVEGGDQGGAGAGKDGRSHISSILSIMAGRNNGLRNSRSLALRRGREKNSC